MNEVENTEKPYEIRERAYEFAERVIEITDILPENEINDHLRDQLLKSGTSIGANLEEADGTMTRKDFLNKMALARKEAKEARFWLGLIKKRYSRPDAIEDDIKEVVEMIRIISAIINKTKMKDTD